MIRKFGSSLKIAAASSVMEDVMRADTKDGNQNKPEVIESKHKDFLYFRSRAISAGDQGPEKGKPNPNGNGDYFPRTELESSYKTFENRQLFLNHESDHPVKSVGKIISAEAIEDEETGEFYIECLSKIDRKLHPEIARKIETGELNTVSMGCSCEESMCSVCATQVYTDEDEKCEHLSPAGLGKIYNASIDMPEYGIHKGQSIEAFSINKGLNFTELSIVSVPADDQAIIKTVLANAKSMLSKNASVTKEDRINVLSHVEKILERLDDDTKEKFKKEICACEVTKEDSKMPEKVKSKSEEFNEKEAIKLNEEDHINMILNEKRSFFDHDRLLTSYFKKKQKELAEKKAKKETEVKKDEKTESSFVERISKKIKDAIMFKVKEEKKATDPKPQPKPKSKLKFASTTVSAKYDDKAKSWSLYKGVVKIIERKVADLWDAKQLKDDKFVKDVTSNSYGNALIAKYKKLGPAKFAKVMGLAYKSMDVKDSKVKEPSKSEFKKPGEKSSADKEHDKSKTAIDKADEETPGQHLEKHEEPIAEKKESAKDEKIEKQAKKCMNCNKQLDDCTCDPSQTETSEKDHSVKQEAKIEKNAWKKVYIEKKKGKWQVLDDSGKSHGKFDSKDDAHKLWKKLEKDKQASVDKEAATEMLDMENKPQIPEEEVKDELPVEKPEEEPKVNDVKMPADEKPESAFDKLGQPIIIGDGYEADKDKETGEIVVKKDGEEVQRMPDAFSTEVADVMKLLQSILGVQTQEEAPGKVEEPAVLHEEHAPADVHEEEEVPEMALASKKDNIKKEADQKLSKKEAELKEKEEKLKEKEASIKLKEEKVAAQKFSSAVNSRLDRCKTIIKSMLNKDLLEVNETTEQASLEDGANAIDAKQAGLRYSITNQIKELMAMDDLSLNSFEKSVKGVKQHKAANRLTTPLSIPYEETHTVDTELNDIFSTMGSKGGSQNFQ